MILLIILALGSVRTTAQPRVLFRIDDFGIDNEEFYPKLFEIFKRHNAKLLVGIVPFEEKYGKTDSLSKRQIEVIRSGIEMGVVEIALHGYSHRNNANNGQSDSEFSGLTYSEQFWRIISGKEYLERTFDVEVNVFIPPWNSYDQNTVKALSKSGIPIISPSLRDYGLSEDYGLQFIPATASLSELHEHLTNRISVGDELIIVLFHGYDFQENKLFYMNEYPYKVNSNFPFMMVDLKSIFGLMTANKMTNIGMAELLGESGKFSLNRLIKATPQRLLFPLPEWLQMDYPTYYLEENDRNVAPWFNWIVSSFWILLILGIGFATQMTISYYFDRKKYKMLNIMIISTSILIMLYIIIDGVVGTKGFYFIVISCGYLTSLLLVFLTGRTNIFLTNR